MPHRTFFWFVLPSLLAITLFIALPMVSVILQSLYIDEQKQLVREETCNPFNCSTELRVDHSTRTTSDNSRQFNGLKTYSNQNHLAFAKIRQALSESGSAGEFAGKLYNLRFYRALAFTIAYTIIVTPAVLILGFLIAQAVNTLPGKLRGPVVFTSLLPMIVTPLIGSLVLFWMIDTEGIFGVALQMIFSQPELSLKASPALTWGVLVVYGIWHATPFAFVVFYAGLQTVPQDTLESSMIDGANRWERTRFVVLPHLVPVTAFVTIVLLMDSFRVFEPIIGFNAEASATSLSWIIYDDLYGTVALYNSAAATSILTIIFLTIMLAPIVFRLRRHFSF